VAVIDADYEPGQRFIERAYLLAEVVSATDEVLIPGENRVWIDVKREIYLGHAPCDVVLLIEQDRLEVRVDRRTADGWESETLGAGDELVLPAFGHRCAVTDLYEGTPLRPRHIARRTRE
jgi:hypothetical protein